MRKDEALASLTPMLATDFGADPTGKIRTKTHALNRTRSEDRHVTSSKNDKMDGQVYGPDLAAAVGISSETGKDKNGKAFNRSMHKDARP